MPTLEQIMSWATENRLMLGLIGSAAIGNMPEKLPNFMGFPQWCWTWLHDAAKTFLNFRHGGIDQTRDIHVENKLPDEHKDEPKKPNSGLLQLNG